MTREAQVIYHKTWNRMPEAKPEEVKEVCMQNLYFALDIGLDYIGNPIDALEFTKRIKQLQNEIQSI